MTGLAELLSQYWIVGAVALLATLVATPLMRHLALANDLVDHPDEPRKRHGRPVAYLGGLAIFCGWLAGVLVFLFGLGGGPVPAAGIEVPIWVLLGAFVIITVGLLDDVTALRPSVKVAGQFIAAACLANQRFIMPGSGESMIVGEMIVVSFAGEFGAQMPAWVSYAVGTMLLCLFVLGGCNAVNLIDGLDGLATGVTAIAALGFLAVAGFILLEEVGAQGRTLDQARFQMALCLALLGGLLGFLLYNFNPAVIFMGDAGAMLLGYLSVAIILLFATVAPQGHRYVLAGVIIFAVPILDTALTMGRRLWTGAPVFRPGPQHSYSQLMRHFSSRGHPLNRRVKLTVMVLYTVGALFAVLGVLTLYQPTLGYVLAAALAAGLVLLATLHRSAVIPEGEA